MEHSPALALSMMLLGRAGTTEEPMTQDPERIVDDALGRVPAIAQDLQAEMARIIAEGSNVEVVVDELVRLTNPKGGRGRTASLRSRVGSCDSKASSWVEAMTSSIDASEAPASVALAPKGIATNRLSSSGQNMSGVYPGDHPSLVSSSPTNVAAP